MQFANSHFLLFLG